MSEGLFEKSVRMSDAAGVRRGNSWLHGYGLLAKGLQDEEGTSPPGMKIAKAKIMGATIVPEAVRGVFINLDGDGVAEGVAKTQAASATEVSATASKRHVTDDKD